MLSNEVLKSINAVSRYFMHSFTVEYTNDSHEIHKSIIERIHITYYYPGRIDIITDNGDVIYAKDIIKITIR